MRGCIPKHAPTWIRHHKTAGWIYLYVVYHLCDQEVFAMEVIMVVSFKRCGSCDIALLHPQLRCKETFEVMLALIQRGAELLKELVPEHAAGYGQNMSKHVKTCQNMSKLTNMLTFNCNFRQVQLRQINMEFPGSFQQILAFETTLKRLAVFRDWQGEHQGCLRIACNFPNWTRRCLCAVGWWCLPLYP